MHLSLHKAVLLPLLGLALTTLGHTAEARPSRLDKIQHVIVIYGENRSFDNLYGLFPGADGIAQALKHYQPQTDLNGQVLASLPPVWKKGDQPDTSYPAALPNQPFRLDDAAIGKPLNSATRDLVHRFYQNQEQINGGKNDRFAALSDAGGLAMGYYDGSSLPMWQLARQYTLADHFFMGAFGGSFLNHMWLVCACTPEFQSAPDSMRAKVDAQGRLLRKADSPASAMLGPVKLHDGAVTPDGYAVNTTQPPYQPSGIPPKAEGDPSMADPAKHPLPAQSLPTIGDRLTAKGISWAWYAGGWKTALQDRSKIYNDGEVNFQPHHQPFNYFANYAPGTAARAEHLKDGADFLAAIDAGTLPQVAFYKPQGNLNEHPGYTDVMSGDAHIAQIVKRIRASKLWPHTAIIVTYDENGGFWDHVAPPKGDRWGPGTRVPTLIISPYAKKGYVDHTVYDTTSILKFLTHRFRLQPLPGVRANVGDFSQAFN